MWNIPDLYPGDGVIVVMAIVVVAICLTTTVSLLASMLLGRRPTIRYAILVSSLICIVATPLIATVVRVSGTSTFAWNLPVEKLADDMRPDDAGRDPSMTQWLATVFVGEKEPASAHTTIELASVCCPETPPESTAEDSPPSLVSMGCPTRPAAMSAAPPTKIHRFLTLAIVVWLVGIVVLLIRLLTSIIRVFKIWRSCRPFLAPPRLERTGEVLRRVLGTKRLPTILVTDAVESPFATGLVRGSVILPAGLAKKITTSQLCDVLIHECAHVVRRDPVIVILQALVRSLFWPVPLVHWLSRELTRACEEICDNYVLAHRDPLQYAETLLRVATLVSKRQHPGVLVGMLHWPGKLEARITGLIDQHRDKAVRTGRIAPGLCLGLLLLASVAICGTSIRPAPAESAPPSVESASAPADPAPVTPAAVQPAKAAADAPEQSAARKPSEVKSIEVWWGMPGSLGQAFRKQIARFNDSQDLLTVRVRSFNGYAALQRELDKAFQDNRLPDLAIIEIHQIAAFAADNRIRPLDQLIADDPTFKPEDLLPGILTNLRYHDKLYAIPMSRSTPILYYNKDRFTAAGLDPNKPPTTWEEVREMSRALTSPEKGEYGFLATNSAWVFESLVWSNGGELVVDGKPTFAESGAAPLQLWSDMVNLDKTARFASRSGTEFTSGRAAIVVDSTAILSTYIFSSDFGVGATFLPSTADAKNAVPTGGGAAVIPASISADRQAAAWDFVRWFVSTDQAAKWSQATGYLPVRQSARALLKRDGLYDEYPEFEVAIKQMAVAREAPQLPQWGSAWGIIAEAMGTVIRDDAPALKTLKTAETSVDALLNPGVAAKP